VGLSVSKLHAQTTDPVVKKVHVRYLISWWVSC